MAAEAPRPVVEAENRLAGFNADRDRIVQTVIRRVVEARLAAARRGGDASLEYVLNDVAYSEMKRLESARDRKSQRRLAEWRELAGSLVAMGEAERKDRLQALTARFAADVAGNFDPRVYAFASRIMPRALSLFFTPQSLRDGLSGLDRLRDHVRVEGPIDVLRGLCERGTLIVTPTHSSNMDSIVVAYALQQSGLPPVTYGAGKNLFSNRFLGFFMHNLGAYRVDRRLRFELYKDVLKEYSTVLLESGYHSLFFPGGTRCRSNMVESRLKLGLLGTGLTAYQHNLRAGLPMRRIYVVPVTINYHLVLEAETLIDDYLAEVGKARYIIEDDESSRLGRIIEFLRRVLAMEESVVIRFAMPYDPFGNPVDDAGESLDARGRRLDPATFVQGADGQVAEDEQRDAEYTRQLGGELAKAYRRETVFLPSHLAARAIFDAIGDRAGTRDVYRLLRLGPAQLTVPLDDVRARVDRLRARIAARPAEGLMEPRLIAMEAGALVEQALDALRLYHTRPVARRTGDSVEVVAVRLLYYYQNRTAHIAEGSR